MTIKLQIFLFTLAIAFLLAPTNILAAVPTPTNDPGCDMPGEVCCYFPTRHCSNGLTCDPKTKRCITGLAGMPEYPTFNMCHFAKTNPEDCLACVGDKPNDPIGIWTAIGCIPTNPTSLITGIIKLAMGMAGGIAFLIMLFGAFTIITAGGNPEKMAGGQQTITAAVMGLFTILFAAVILNIVGIQIIQIPGF